MEEKLFNALVDPKENVVNERFIETQMVYYHQRMDPRPCCCRYHIWYWRWVFVRVAPFSIYCGKGNDFNQFAFKNKMKELGFNKFLRFKFWLSWNFIETPYQKISLKRDQRILEYGEKTSRLSYFFTTTKVRNTNNYLTCAYVFCI